ncbi:SHOCT domain-containing protein [Streptosporangium subroseum]|uniref:SHOCT domain-containing protein n=1 Tax=Streptosporangium subroseum TaxID=106412 RepID=UPI003084C8AF|nr:SHOCT domain-containing protein [Streptosporangium subroseum]
MRYYVRVCIGSLISLVCLGFALYALYELVRGGSCASGGNYVSVRQCAPGSEKWAWVLPGSIIGGLLSFFLGTFKGFGPPPKADASPAGFAAGAGARTATGAAPSGQADLFGGRVVVMRGQLIPEERGAASPVSGRNAASDADPLDQLRKLQALLDAGTLSRAEFERAKAKILAEM